MCMCVCVYVRACVCVCAHAHACVYTYVHACVCACMHACACVYITHTPETIHVLISVGLQRCLHKLLHVISFKKEYAALRVRATLKILKHKQLK